jgi:ribokinase
MPLPAGFMHSQTSGEARDPQTVLMVSDMCADLVVTGNVRPQFHQVEQVVGDYSLELGGSANIFASQMVKLGARVGVIGYVGQDIFGEFALRELQQIGVDITRVKKHPSNLTGIGIALAEEDDRAILTYLGSIDATRDEDLDEILLRSCQHWHIASCFLLQSLRSFWPHWLQKYRRAGITTSLDTDWDPDNRWEGVVDLLPHIDVFLPNEGEALAITGETDVGKAAKTIANMSPLTVVKCGENGAIAIKGDQTWQVKGTDYQDSPLSIIDTIGAGDNFDAGHMPACLLGHDIDFSLQLAHRCAP